jgi:ADP-ribose pyrophosphatase
MSKLTDYFSFAESHPALFVNPTQDGITILLEEDEIRMVEALMEERLKEKGLPICWAHIGIVYQNQWGLIIRDAVRFPDGSLGTYYRFVSTENRAPGVVVLPLYQRCILLLYRFRYATRTWHFEIPVGPGSKDLCSEENAREELKKDFGATVSQLISLGEMEAGPGIGSDNAEIYLAHVVSYGNVNPQEGINKLLQVTVSEFEHMIRENEITDLFTIIAYTRAKHRGLF